MREHTIAHSLLHVFDLGANLQIFFGAMAAVNLLLIAFAIYLYKQFSKPYSGVDQQVYAFSFSSHVRGVWRVARARAHTHTHIFSPPRAFPSLFIYLLSLRPSLSPSLPPSPVLYFFPCQLTDTLGIFTVIPHYYCTGAHRN